MRPLRVICAGPIVEVAKLDYDPILRAITSRVSLYEEPLILGENRRFLHDEFAYQRLRLERVAMNASERPLSAAEITVVQIIVWPRRSRSS